MSEVIRDDWFDLADGVRNDMWAWLHSEFLPDLQAADGVSWVGHYDIVQQPDGPYVEGAPQKVEADPSECMPGWQNVILSAATSAEAFFGPGNAVDALGEKHTDKLAACENHRYAVFMEEEVVNAPESHQSPYGMGPPPAMQLGNYNTRSPDDDYELARWYRAERFPRVAVSKGMIRGRKLLSIAGWPKHGVLWEGVELAEDEFSFEKRFVDADRGYQWPGRHVLEYVVHAPKGPHAGRLVWPKPNRERPPRKDAAALV